MRALMSLNCTNIMKNENFSALNMFINLLFEISEI